ncbi:unnamed protein product [Ilex paraguariensis]|uniref:Zinc-ribbon domain-containing protein n=1 Tax=Ilex paraguariensis TaxID=185542 RepID=A0ABC8QYY6_9AQUA
MSQTNTKVRFVRCPRCREVLPEMADFPVYICGGCDIILEAKNRKNETKDTRSHLHKTDHPQENGMDNISEDREASKSNKQAVLPSTAESSPDKTRERTQYEFGHCNMEHPGGRNISNELLSSSELLCRGNEELSPEARVPMEMDEDKCHLDQYNGMNQNNSGDCNGKRPEGRTFPNLLHRSSELTCHENGESSPEAIALEDLDEDECPSPRCSGRHRNEIADSIEERTAGLKFSTEVSSTEVCHRCPLSTGAGVHIAVDESKFSLEFKNGWDQSKYEGYNGKEPGNINDSKEVSSSAELTCHEVEEQSMVANMVVGGAGVEGSSSIELTCHQVVEQSSMANMAVGGAGVEVKVSSSTALSHEIEEQSTVVDMSSMAVGSTDLTHHEVEEQSTLAEMAVGGTGVEVAEDCRSGSLYRSSSPKKFQATNPNDSVTSAQRPLDESISADDLTSPPKELLEQSQNCILQGFDRVSSLDTSENLPSVKPSPGVGVKFRDMYRSPTSRMYYAYDGSLSSLDGTDDQIPDWHLHVRKRNSKEARVARTNGLPRRNEFRVKDVVGSELEMHHRAMNPSSVAHGKKHHAMEGTKQHGDELPPPTRHSLPFRGKMRLETDEHLSRMPFYSKGSPSGHGNGMLSRHGHKEFQNQSSYHSPDEPGYPEQDRMELLRMVCELNDQLNRTHISKMKANSRVPAGVRRMEKQIAPCYDHLASEDMYHELNYPGYPRRYMQRKNQLQCGRISRMAFSGETTHCRHQIDCSCLHCCPQTWHHSVQSPPCVVCCNKSRTSHHTHGRYNLYSYSPSSPQHYASSEYSSWRRDDIMSDDQWPRDHEVKKLPQREKHHSMKRHIQPVAGGAPVIACYRCLKLLQLPADFLLSGRKCHRLRCSACSAVLTFSLQNSTQRVPFIPGAIAPPPSEVDDYSDAINKRNVASTSHANVCPHAEPVSYSDDYGHSVCKSCSTEGYPFSLAPFHILKRNPTDRKMSYGSSFELMKERRKKAALKELNKYKNPMVESAGPSSHMYNREKSSFEIEKLKPTTCSPLHQLMGYSSPSQVTRR